MEFVFWLFATPTGWCVLAALILPGVFFGLRAANQGFKRDVSADKMAHRDLVARCIERGDYLVMPEKDFREWLDANPGSIFPHELEAMERARKAKVETKPKPARQSEQKPDRLHPYQN